ncbi:DUF1419 domain-containing protein, partial [Escherichia coli]
SPGWMIAMTDSQKEMYFYIPGRATAQDGAVCNAAGEYIGMWSGKTLEAYQVEYPTMILVSWEDLQQKILDAAKRPVSEIDAEKYNDMLEVMPPLNWRGANGNSSFMLMEMYTMDITDIFVAMKVNGNEKRYFTLRDSSKLDQSEIYKMCFDYMATC